MSPKLFGDTAFRAKNTLKYSFKKLRRQWKFMGQMPLLWCFKKLYKHLLI